MDDVENSIQGLFEVVRDRKHHYLRESSLPITPLVR